MTDEQKTILKALRVCSGNESCPYSDEEDVCIKAMLKDVLEQVEHLCAENEALSEALQAKQKELDAMARDFKEAAEESSDEYVWACHWCKKRMLNNDCKSCNFEWRSICDENMV